MYACSVCVCLHQAPRAASASLIYYDNDARGKVPVILTIVINNLCDRAITDYFSFIIIYLFKLLLLFRLFNSYLATRHGDVISDGPSGGVIGFRPQAASLLLSWSTATPSLLLSPPPGPPSPGPQPPLLSCSPPLLVHSHPLSPALLLSWSTATLSLLLSSSPGPQPPPLSCTPPLLVHSHPLSPALSSSPGPQPPLLSCSPPSPGPQPPPLSCTPPLLVHSHPLSPALSSSPGPQPSPLSCSPPPPLADPVMLQCETVKKHKMVPLLLLMTQYSSLPTSYFKSSSTVHIYNIT